MLCFLSANQSLTLRLRPQSLTKNNSGVLEVYDGISQWGFICPTPYLSYEDADIVCRHLGYSSAVRAYTVVDEDANRNRKFFLKGLRSRQECWGACTFDQLVSLGWTGPLGIWRYCDGSDVAGVECLSK